MIGQINTLKQLFLISLLLFSTTLNAQSRILVDGFFEDWLTQPVLDTDASGDGGNSGIDFGKVKVFNDREFIFFSVEVGSTINLQDNNDIALYIDIDNNANTGSSINGIGAELTYAFGDRSGSYNGARIRHADIGMITAPTTSSNRFEIAIKRTFNSGGSSITMGSAITVLFKDNTSNGDQAPSANGGLAYTISGDQQLPLPSYAFNKPTKSDIRILSYNVERDGFFTADRVPSYTRILQAIQPDIIGFQEIYDNTSQQVAAQVESMLPSAANEQWYFAGEEPDCHAISRYPITKSAPIAGVSSSGNAAFLIDLPDTEKDMLFVVAHPPCCTNDAGRQIEVDQIMQFVREAKEGKGPIPLEEGALIMIVGDMNFVGDGAQLQTLLFGDISDEASYGPDFTPDWDGNNLIDCKPYTTGVPFSYSWYSESSAFSPGRLDYILYSGSNLDLDNTYSLFTPGMSSFELAQYDLQSSDVLIASDHLPLVADFTLKNSSTNSIYRTDANSIHLQVHPNPAFGKTNISFINPTTNAVSIQLTDLNGREVEILYAGILASGKQTISFNSSAHPVGSYILTFKTPDTVYHKKVAIMQ
ncbi:MAG: T9SS type A sorting domain-containing protein [Bacteroidia bacterium]|jgi:endonuclease/exonuclease/phosphatase family metal-dependent hydrolase|nr:T9SS type A sorting domain-containing protein [Bacteroidia bacterium]